MCEFCIKHGEGKKWYLNVKNYSYDLLSDVKRRKYVQNHFYWIDETYKHFRNIMKFIPLHLPVIGHSVRTIVASIIKRTFTKTHWSQIIPIEDVVKILSFTNSITRIPCVCRKITTGKVERLCFLISINPEKLGIAGIIDQSFFGGPDVAKFETFGKERTLAFFKESEKKGMVHTIWALRAPFIGILCNCDLATGCIPMKMINNGTPFTFRAEYVAQVDINNCSGCKACIKNCPFDAIKFNVEVKRIEIDEKKCYGCGICRAVCKKDAIYLKDRKLISAAAHLW